MHILTMLFRFIDSIIEARNIKKEPERRQKCMKFGISSIIYAVVAVPFALLMCFAIGFLQGEGILLLIFVIALPLIGAVGMLIFLINAIAYWLLQISVNRKAVTWISLAVLLLCVAACALAVVAALGLLS